MNWLGWVVLILAFGFFVFEIVSFIISMRNRKKDKLAKEKEQLNKLEESLNNCHEKEDN